MCCATAGADCRPAKDKSSQIMWWPAAPLLAPVSATLVSTNTTRDAVFAFIVSGWLQEKFHGRLPIIHEGLHCIECNGRLNVGIRYGRLKFGKSPSAPKQIKIQSVIWRSNG